MSTGLLDRDGCIPGCFYVRDDGTTIEYKLKTDPPEAAFWTTYKLKPSHIKVVGKYDRKTKSALAKEICDEITRHEQSKPKPSIEDKIRKKRQAARRQHAEVGEKQQKTG